MNWEAVKWFFSFKNTKEVDKMIMDFLILFFLKSECGCKYENRDRFKSFEVCEVHRPQPAPKGIFF